MDLCLVRAERNTLSARVSAALGALKQSYESEGWERRPRRREDEPLHLASLQSTAHSLMLWLQPTAHSLMLWLQPTAYPQ